MATVSCFEAGAIERRLSLATAADQDTGRIGTTFARAVLPASSTASGL
jgi:hypothetical protein